mmetsp:Transcript_13331/g.20692  ORF Transcript_13331/g.20692 Transcript_13331/m.20692 type:complete len:133 (+) Transcript_13331:141-539(+)
MLPQYSGLIVNNYGIGELLVGLSALIMTLQLEGKIKMKKADDVALLYLFFLFYDTLQPILFLGLRYFSQNVDLINVKTPCSELLSAAEFHYGILANNHVFTLLGGLYVLTLMTSTTKAQMREEGMQTCSTWC